MARILRLLDVHCLCQMMWAAVAGRKLVSSWGEPSLIRGLLL